MKGRFNEVKKSERVAQQTYLSSIGNKKFRFFNKTLKRDCNIKNSWCICIRQSIK